MRFVVDWDEGSRSWMVWDRDRMMHCGFFKNKLEADRVASDLNDEDK